MKILLVISFIFQLIAIVAYIFLFDLLTYISVFSLWLGSILFGFNFKELLKIPQKILSPYLIIAITPVTAAINASNRPK